MHLFIWGIISLSLAACGPSTVSVTVEKGGVADSSEMDDDANASNQPIETVELDCDTAPYVSWENC